MAPPKKYTVKALNQPSLTRELFDFVVAVAEKRQSTRSSVVRSAIEFSKDAGLDFELMAVGRPFGYTLNNIAITPDQRLFVDGLGMEESSAIRSILQFYKESLK